MSPTPSRACKDCKAEWERRGEGPPKVLRRVVAKSGGRCATHDRAEKNRRKKAAHERYVQKTYSLAPGEYDELYDFQGGRCAICARATGATKNLAVDHDHGCCSGPTSCGRCVRGLVCGPCNSMLAHVRDNPAVFRRGVTYLYMPPRRRMLMQRGVRNA